MWSSTRGEEVRLKWTEEEGQKPWFSCWCHKWMTPKVSIVLCCIAYLWAHSPLPSSLGEFPGYWDWLWCPGLPPMLVSIAFSSSISRCFSIHFFFICHWISFMFLFYDWCICTHSVDPSLTHFFRCVSRFGTSPGTRCCGPRGRAGVHRKQKSHFKFLLWLGFALRTLQSNGCEHYH